MSLPTVSIVVASGAGGDFLFRCLDSLLAQAAEAHAEIIVVDRCGEATLERVRRTYPQVIAIAAPTDHHPSVPELRMIGAKRSSGTVLAVIEEHCIAPQEWLRTIRESFRDTDAAIGGPILDHDYPRIRDWVVYFSEYHNYLPPWRNENRFVLNGANIAYSRAKLLQLEHLLTAGYWEVALHPELAKLGAFRAVPSMGVYHTGPFDYGYYLGQRYLLSRVWGGTQRSTAGLGKRLTYLVAAPIFPFLLLARIARRVLESGRLIPKFLMAVPLLVPVTMAYVWGEWRGYLGGVGDALERVE